MGVFDRPGEFDEQSLWNLLRTPEQRTLDQAIKANRRLEVMAENLAASSNASPAAPNVARQVVELERKVLALGLYARTILQVLVDKGVITNEEFAARVRDLDLLDGAEDGR